MMTANEGAAVKFHRAHNLAGAGARTGAVAAAAIGAVLWAAASTVQARPIETVVVTIKPIHSLVAAVMGDAGTPYLLVKGSGSPHDYALKPSDARALAHASILFQISPNLEVFLKRSRRAMPRSVRTVSLIKAAGLELLELRGAGRLDNTGAVAGKAVKRQPRAKHGSTIDTHIWLDPANAIKIVGHIAKVLSALYPETAALFKTNAAAVTAKLMALDKELADQLRPLAGKPYFVYHDAYQYFERRYGLAPAGAVSLSPDQQPGARRITQLRRMVKKSRAGCMFTEPQFLPKLARVIVEGTATRIAELDPIGAALPAGPSLYHALMRNMASSLRRCLGAARE